MRSRKRRITGGIEIIYIYIYINRNAQRKGKLQVLENTRSGHYQTSVDKRKKWKKYAI